MNPIFTVRPDAQERIKADIVIHMDDADINIEMYGNGLSLLAALCEGLRRLHKAGASTGLIKDAVDFALTLGGEEANETHRIL